MPDDIQQLREQLRTNFERAAKNYQAVIAQLEAAAQQRRDQGVIRAGLQSMILKRYYGSTHNWRQLISDARDGAAWSYFFVFGVTPRRVYQAWQVSHAIGERPANAARDIAVFDTQAATVSITASAAISKLLKMVGTRAQSETARLLAMRSRTAWRITGIFGILYGLASISTVMNQTDRKFGGALRIVRDSVNGNDARRFAERLENALEETGPLDY